MSKKVYHTQAREALLRTLALHAGKALTAEEIYSLLPPDTAGRSTIYRLLSAFAAEGILTRSLREDRRAQYLFPDRQDCQRHMHLRCAQCGKLVHLHEEESAAMRSEFLAHYGIRLDSAKTILVGDCEDCILHREAAHED